MIRTHHILVTGWVVALACTPAPAQKTAAENALKAAVVATGDGAVIDFYQTTPGACEILLGKGATDAHLSALAKLRVGEVAKINMAPVEKLNGTTIAELVKATPKLATLSVPKSFSNADLKLVADVNPSVTELTLFACKVTDEGLAHLSKFKRLKKLNLIRLDGISDACWDGLAAVASLEEIMMSGYPVTGKGVRALGGLKKLSLLDISYCQKLSDEGAGELQHLTSLGQLKVNSTPISNAGVGGFGKLDKLWLLDLANTKVGDAGVATLSPLPKLLVLDLSNNVAVTDASVPALSKLSKLVELKLGGTKVTADGVKKLQAALPKCKIDAR